MRQACCGSAQAVEDTHSWAVESGRPCTFPDDLGDLFTKQTSSSIRFLLRILAYAEQGGGHGTSCSSCAQQSDIDTYWPIDNDICETLGGAVRHRQVGNFKRRLLIGSTENNAGAAHTLRTRRYRAAQSHNDPGRTHRE